MNVCDKHYIFVAASSLLYFTYPTRFGDNTKEIFILCIQLLELIFVYYNIEY